MTGIQHQESGNAWRPSIEVRSDQNLTFASFVLAHLGHKIDNVLYVCSLQTVEDPPLIVKKGYVCSL